MSVLKLTVGEEVRRIGEPPQDLKKLMRKATELFKIENPCFRYEDEDGDMVIVFNQEEYQEALSIMKKRVKLEVLSSDLVLLKRSSFLMNSIKDEQSSFRCESFNDFSKLSIIFPTDRDTLKPQEASIEIQTDDIFYLDKETSSQTSEDKSTEALLFKKDSETHKETAINSYEELINIFRKYTSGKFKDKIQFLGVKCIKCKSDIYDALYKCTQCSNFYLCESCEINDTHLHILTKSRNKIESLDFIPSEALIKKNSLPYISSEDSRPIEFITKIKSSDFRLSKPPEETAKGNRNDISVLMGKLKNMGFTDSVTCMNALIKNSYNIEKSIDHLLNK
jgi:PB1 domain/Zinc finger, ZZ type